MDVVPAAPEPQPQKAQECHREEAKDTKAFVGSV